MSQPKVWITSDLHLNHSRVPLFSSTSLEQNGLSHIKTIEDWNEMIISRINQLVREQDTLWILGDVGFGPVDELKTLINRINGHKILVMGNHDKFSMATAYHLGFEKVYDSPTFLPGTRGMILLSHAPAFEAYVSPYIACNLHGHIHEGTLTLPRFFNMNISMNDYYPVDAAKFLKYTANSRYESFLHEWYIAWEKTINMNRKDVVLKPNGYIDLAASANNPQLERYTAKNEECKD